MSLLALARRPRGLALGALLALLPASPGALRADGLVQADPAGDAFDACLAAVVAPAQEQAVRELMKRPELKEAQPALQAVGRLWHGGGPHAALALRTLASHPDLTVKEAALRGIAVIGLRTEAGSRGEREIRRALTHAEKPVRRAAYEAVGATGSGDDVASLVLGLVSEEPDVRSLALRALRTLTGEPLTADATRWAYWWERSRTKLEEQLETALETLGEVEVEELVEAQAWDVVERRAWLLPAQVETLARACLGSMDPTLRLRGYRLAACARMASLAADVLKAERQDARGAADETLQRAKRTLGLLPPGA
jgi:hypothetical protein